MCSTDVPTCSPHQKSSVSPWILTASVGVRFCKSLCSRPVVMSCQFKLFASIVDVEKLKSLLYAGEAVSSEGESVICHGLKIEHD